MEISFPMEVGESRSQKGFTRGSLKWVPQCGNTLLAPHYLTCLTAISASSAGRIHLHVTGIILDSKRVLLKAPASPGTNSNRNERSRLARVPGTDSSSRACQVNRDHAWDV